VAGYAYECRNERKRIAKRAIFCAILQLYGKPKIGFKFEFCVSFVNLALIDSMHFIFAHMASFTQQCPVKQTYEKVAGKDEDESQSE
jgi:hypothetical protein